MKLAIETEHITPFWCETMYCHCGENHPLARSKRNNGQLFIAQFLRNCFLEFSRVHTLLRLSSFVGNPTVAKYQPTLNFMF